MPLSPRGRPSHETQTHRRAQLPTGRWEPGLWTPSSTQQLVAGGEPAQGRLPSARPNLAPSHGQRPQWPGALLEYRPIPGGLGLSWPRGTSRVHTGPYFCSVLLHAKILENCSINHRADGVNAILPDGGQGVGSVGSGYLGPGVGGPSYLTFPLDSRWASHCRCTVALRT